MGGINDLNKVLCERFAGHLNDLRETETKKKNQSVSRDRKDGSVGKSNCHTLQRPKFALLVTGVPGVLIPSSDLYETPVQK